MVAVVVVVIVVIVVVVVVVVVVVACEDVKTINTKTKFICFRISEKV